MGFSFSFGMFKMAFATLAVVTDSCRALIVLRSSFTLGGQETRQRGALGATRLSTRCRTFT